MLLNNLREIISSDHKIMLIFQGEKYDYNTHFNNNNDCFNQWGLYIVQEIYTSISHENYLIIEVTKE